MNAILVDVLEERKKENIIIKFRNIFFRKSEYEYSSNLKFVSIDINKNMLEKIIECTSNNTYFRHIHMIYIKLLEKLFKRKLKRYILSIKQNDICILSSNILKNIEYNMYISKLIEECSIKEPKLDNTMLINDIKNIDEYISKNNLDISKLKILYIFNLKESLDIARLLTYINKYKFIDVLCITKASSYIKKIVNNLNNEYGTSIEVVEKKNLSKYDIYVLLDIYKNNLSDYILNKKKLIIELNNCQGDLFNPYNKVYDKSTSKLNKINNIEMFNKTYIGYALDAEDSHLTNSV